MCPPYLSLQLTIITNCLIAMKGKRGEGKIISSFQANYIHQGDTQYPYYLAVSLNNSEDQFEQCRSMKMLGEWVEEYEKMSEIFKCRYSSYIPKILKLLFNKYQAKAPIEYCLARFLLSFFPIWEEFTLAIASNLYQSDRYTMEFIWYTCHNLVEDLNLQKQPFIIDFLTKNFEKGLLHYEPETSVEARKILQIVFLLNIHGCQPSFQKHVDHWSKKCNGFQESSHGDPKLAIMIDIIRNKSLLQSSQNSNQYWLRQIENFLEILEEKVEAMSCKDGLSSTLLDLFLWLLEIEDIKKILLQKETRYMRTLLQRSRPKGGNPDSLFLIPKYQEIRDILYNLYFKRDPEKTKTRLLRLLEQFVGHSFFVFNDQNNYAFLDCLTERNIELSVEAITDVIRLLGNNHVRRSLSTKIILVFCKAISASLDSCQLTIEVVGQCLKAFNQSMGNKINDPLIGELRAAVSHLFLRIMRGYIWQNGFKNEIIFGFCEDYERNSKDINENIFEILELLITKFGYSNETKLEPLINDIFIKTLTSEDHLHTLISLLVTVGSHLNFPRASTLVQQLCAKNPSPHANFFLFQALALTRSGPPTDNDVRTIRIILASSNHWDPTRIDINLMMMQIFFLKLQPPEAFSFLLEIDSQIEQKFKTWYEGNNYRLLTLVAGKILGAVGGDPEQLQTLKTYRWFREYSFEMLARSFYKSTSINVCYVFSNIILKSEKPGVTIRWLVKDQFLDYLYQGLNDFLSKQKSYTKEVATSILVYKLFLNEPSLIPQGSRLLDFSTLTKNVTWWDSVNNEIVFVPFQDKQQYTVWTLPQFKTHYQTTINRFFKRYFSDYAERKKRAAEQELLIHEEDI